MSLSAGPGWVAPNMGCLKPKASQSCMGKAPGLVIPEALRRTLCDLIINHKDRKRSAGEGGHPAGRGEKGWMSSAEHHSVWAQMLLWRLVTRGRELVKL